VCVCLCVRQAAIARRISLGGEGNALYPVVTSTGLLNIVTYKVNKLLSEM